MYVLGIDVGTQGARTVVCDNEGTVHASASQSFDSSAQVAGQPPRWAEQKPNNWWSAVSSCLRQTANQPGGDGVCLDAVEAVSVTSTSGTIVPVDKSGTPLRPAMMYNDSRAQVEAEEVQAAGREQATALGYRFTPSFALSKILWLQRHEPDLFAASHRFIHAADYVVGQLTGQYTTTDFSNALKTGYDLLNDRWPDFIERDLGIPLDQLPEVVQPGTPVGRVSKQCAADTGLPAGIPVLAGMTDGCASQISTGAVSPGDWCTTLGTTLVVKGVTAHLLLDAEGRIYSHRHPDGYWLPGGASNTGGEALAQRFPRDKWDTFNRQALDIAPTGVVMYPLVRKGERFPFSRPDAEGFTLGNGVVDEVTQFTAHMEGVAFLERLAYDMLESLGTVVGEVVFNAGGATHSWPWTQLRADVLGRCLSRPETTGGSMGAAIIAAAGTWFDGIIPAASAMVRITERVEPRLQTQAAYQDLYLQFRQECKERGYI